MNGLSTVWDAVIAALIVLAVLLVALALLSRRGRRVHLQIDIGGEDGTDEGGATDSGSVDRGGRGDGSGHHHRGGGDDGDSPDAG